MTELSYSKSFLAMLAPRPLRLPADHVQDPRQLPARTPYTLPRTHPEPKKRARTAASSVHASVTLTLKPLRPTPGLSPLSLAQTGLSTTIATLKQKYAASTGVDAARLKLLLKGKPLADVKTLGELGFQDADEATITVMFMAGGATATPEVEMKDGLAAAKIEVLKQDAFWNELGVFLTERLGKEEVEEDPEKVLAAFRGAWKA